MSIFLYTKIIMIHFSLVSQSCPILCDTIDFSMPGFPVYHQLPEPTQSHVHCVSDAIRPSLLLSPSPLAFNLSQHQGLPMSRFFTSGSQSTGYNYDWSNLYNFSTNIYSGLYIIFTRTQHQ